jgi:hypothetical protein
MKLRSQTVLDNQVRYQRIVSKLPSPKSVEEFTSDFFDESSKAWKANKIEVVKGIYKYKKMQKEQVVEQVQQPLRKSPRLLEKQKQEVVQTPRRSPRFQ